MSHVEGCECDRCMVERMTLDDAAWECDRLAGLAKDNAQTRLQAAWAARATRVRAIKAHILARAIEDPNAHRCVKIRLMPKAPDPPCARCRGRYTIEVHCKDPECGDSTWDHECGNGWTPCPDCSKGSTAAPSEARAVLGAKE